MRELIVSHEPKFPCDLSIPASHCVTTGDRRSAVVGFPPWRCQISKNCVLLEQVWKYICTGKLFYDLYYIPADSCNCLWQRTEYHVIWSDASKHVCIHSAQCYILCPRVLFRTLYILMYFIYYMNYYSKQTLTAMSLINPPEICM